MTVVPTADPSTRRPRDGGWRTTAWSALGLAAVGVAGWWGGTLVAAGLGTAGVGWWWWRRARHDEPTREGAEPAAPIATPPGVPQTAATKSAGTPAAPASASGNATDAAAPRLGPYSLGPVIGYGTTGTLYRSVDERDGRTVALKVLDLVSRDSDRLDAEELEARFEREAGAARRLQHPDIVRVLDSGRLPGRAWLAMELLPGTDLRDAARPGRLLPVGEVLHIVRRIALALAHAHRQGVVHRDVKPENVMTDAATGMVKVLDFGIARVADTTQTRTGLMLGTPAYMSPEQLAGERVDGRSDLYSLGALLFQLLTGRPPFEDASAARLMSRIVAEAPPDLRDLRPDLPPALADIVALALQKRPEIRYADGIELAEDLELVQGLLLPDVNSAAPGSPSVDRVYG